MDYYFKWLIEPSGRRPDTSSFLFRLSKKVTEYLCLGDFILQKIQLAVFYQPKSFVLNSNIKTISTVHFVLSYGGLNCQYGINNSI